MTEIWQQHFIDLLKFLESQGEPVHEFRRSYETGHKKDRVYASLADIYEGCKEKLDSAFIDWFNSQSFKVQNGLKTITLKCSVDKNMFEQYLRQLFSHWNPDIKFSIPEKPQSKSSLISKKKITKAMKYMNSAQHRRNTSMVSSEQLEALLSNSDIRSLVQQIQENST